MQIRGPGLLRANECFLGRKKPGRTRRGCSWSCRALNQNDNFRPILMFRPEVVVRSSAEFPLLKLRKFPGAASFTITVDTPPLRNGAKLKFSWLSTLKISARYSSPNLSLSLKFFNTFRCMVMEPGVYTAFLLAVRAFAGEKGATCTQRTSFAVTQVPLAPRSGLINPVPQVELIWARELNGAFQLPTSGRSPDSEPSRSRSRPLMTVYGCPEETGMMVAKVHPPKACPRIPCFGPRTCQSALVIHTCRQSLSEGA